MSEALVRIVPFAPGDAADFKALNVEWLQRYFQVEPIDEEVLSAPDRILAAGGSIFMARSGDRNVGTVTLLHVGDGSYELTKMAVTPQWQGLGIARQLLTVAIDAWRALGGRHLYLESNSMLTPALTLYESAGFVHSPRPEGPSHYLRADVYMVYRG